jgi:hypothetical protein
VPSTGGVPSTGEALGKGGTSGFRACPLILMIVSSAPWHYVFGHV